MTDLIMPTDAPRHQPPTAEVCTSPDSRVATVVLRLGDPSRLLECAEAEQFAAGILRACAAARAYQPPARANGFNKRGRARG